MLSVYAYLIIYAFNLSKGAFFNWQKAKLGAAVTIVEAGIDVIISQCGSECTEKFVKGNWKSIWDLESGTLLSGGT